MGNTEMMKRERARRVGWTRMKRIDDRGEPPAEQGALLRRGMGVRETTKKQAQKHLTRPTSLEMLKNSLRGLQVLCEERRINSLGRIVESETGIRRTFSIVSQGFRSSGSVL